MAIVCLPTHPNRDCNAATITCNAFLFLVCRGKTYAMKKILLLNPPFHQKISRDSLCPHICKSDYSWPGMDLVAISGILSAENIEYVDCLKENICLQDLGRRLQLIKPDFVFMLIASISEKDDVAAINVIKQTTNATIAVLGDIATFDADRVAVMPGIGFVIRDYTNTIEIRKICKMEQKTRVIDFALINNFKIGIPRHELFQKYNYYYPYSLYDHVTPVLANYGCPFKCKMCNSGSLKYRTRDSAEVMQELAYIRQLGIKEIYFKDYTFLVVNNRSILQFMIDHNLGLRFSCTTRIDAVDKDKLELLKRAGCYLVFYGVESGSNAILQCMNKGFTAERAKEIISLTKSLGIEVLTSFVIGFEQETEQDIIKTADIIFATDPDYLSLNILESRQGSELDNLRREGIKIISGECMSDIRKRIERKFYFRPYKLLKYVRLFSKSPCRIKRSIRQLRSMIMRVS